MLVRVKQVMRFLQVFYKNKKGRGVDTICGIQVNRVFTQGFYNMLRKARVTIPFA